MPRGVGWTSLEESLLDKENLWGKRAVVSTQQQRLVDVRFAYPVAFSLELAIQDFESRAPLAATLATFRVGLGADRANDIRTLVPGTHTLHGDGCWVDAFAPDPTVLPKGEVAILAWASIWPVDLAEVGTVLTSAGATFGPPPGPGIGVEFTISAANISRKGLFLYNDSTANLELFFRTGTAVNFHTLVLFPQDYWEPPDDEGPFTSAVFGRWQAAGVGFLRRQEWT